MITCWHHCVLVQIYPLWDQHPLDQWYPSVIDLLPPNVLSGRLLKVSPPWCYTPIVLCLPLTALILEVSSFTSLGAGYVVMILDKVLLEIDISLALTYLYLSLFWVSVILVDLPLMQITISRVVPGAYIWPSCRLRRYVRTGSACCSDIAQSHKTELEG